MAQILIVDDDPGGCEALATYLRRYRHTVECQPNGREALTAILGRTPDLVVLDLYMPEIDGAGLLDIIRAYLRFQSLPVVVLTGLPESTLADRARRMKVNSILVKGKSTLEEIRRTIEQELQRPSA